MYVQIYLIYFTKISNLLSIFTVNKYYYATTDLDDVLQKILTELLKRDRGLVLGGDDDGMHSERHACSSIEGVLDGNLRLAVRKSPVEHTTASQLMKSLHELVSQHQGKGHGVLSFIGRVTEHESLKK